MEVQAQYPSSAALFTQNYPRKVTRLPSSSAVPFFHVDDSAAAAAAQVGNLSGAVLPQQQMFLNGTTLFSGEPESELTCNASGSRKRAFDGSVTQTMLQLNLQQQRKTPPAGVLGEVAAVREGAACAGMPSCLQMSCNQVRVNNPGTASTSGRPPTGDPVATVSPLAEELVSQLYHQSLEIDAFIRLQNERVRSGLEEARKRHHRALLSAMEQGVLQCLRQKEAEVESASRRNAELEEKIRQLASENQIWFNVARSKEAIASSLRATLEQVLLQNATAIPGAAAADGAVFAAQPRDLEEGYGESDCASPVFPADDAQSCCYGDSPAAACDAERGTAMVRENLCLCKVCRKRELSVLLLPCQHLSLCEQCDSAVLICPVCGAAKNGSLHVFIC